MSNRAFARIPNISIPKDSVVFGVYARCIAYSNLPGNTVNLRCAFVAADDPDAPTTYSALQSYNVTDWVSWSGLEAWVANEVYDTPDLSDILQQVINRDNWQSGNAVILIIEDINSNDQRSFISVRVGDNDKGLMLFAQYYAVEGGGTGVFPAGECSLPNASEWCFRGTEFPPIMEGMGCMEDGQFMFPAEDTSENRVSRLVTNWYGNITQASVNWDAADLPNGGYMEFGLSFLVYGGGPYTDTIDQQQYLCETGSGIDKYAAQSQTFLFGPIIMLNRDGIGVYSIEILQNVGPNSTMYVGDGISGSYYAYTTINSWTGSLTGTWKIKYTVTERAMVDDIWYPLKNEFRVYINNVLVFHTQFRLNYGATSPLAAYGMGTWYLITDKHLFAYMGFDINHPAEKGTKENFGAFSNFSTMEDFREYTYWNRKNPVSYLDWDIESGVAPSGPTDGAPSVLPYGYCVPPAVWSRIRQQCEILVVAN